MQHVTEIAARVAQTDTTVLLEGESGTGKELLAKAIHFHSARKDRPLIIVNCAAIAENLLESELFGHRRGSFTGATSDKQGKFEAANDGTIFLDEIGDLPLSMQTELLRVLQEGQVDKVGDVRPVSVDIRVLAATNRDLEKMVSTGDFRDDLYYRLAVVAIRIPALRERTDDVPLLVEHFVAKHSVNIGRPRIAVAPEAKFLSSICTHGPATSENWRMSIQRALVLYCDTPSDLTICLNVYAYESRAWPSCAWNCPTAGYRSKTSSASCWLRHSSSTAGIRRKRRRISTSAGVR